jgi:DNA mismatch repair protein MutL
MDVDPSQIDVNIHPTKTEIKFEDERSIYQIIFATVREALGKSSLGPAIDFNIDGAIDIPIFKPGAEYPQPVIPVNPDYNPFESKRRSGDSVSQGGYVHGKSAAAGWEKLFENPSSGAGETLIPQTGQEARTCLQIKNKYILVPVKSGLMVIQQSRAFERILFEEFMKEMNETTGPSQQVLFPTTFELGMADLNLLMEIKDELAAIGFDLEPFGGQSVIIRGIPASIENQDARRLIEKLLDQFKNETDDPAEQMKDRVARNVARISSLSFTRPLDDKEMQVLVDRLFACREPQFTPSGKAVLTILQMDEIEKRFL